MIIRSELAITITPQEAADVLVEALANTEEHASIEATLAQSLRHYLILQSLISGTADAEILVVTISENDNA